MSLGGLARVEEEPGHGPPMPRMQMMAAGAMAEDASTEVAAGDLTVTRQVRAWFSIE